MFARGVTCGDCHEPHSAQLVAEGDALCTRCHNEAGHTGFPTLRLADYDTPEHHLHSAGSEGGEVRVLSHAGADLHDCGRPARSWFAHPQARSEPLPWGFANACNGCHEDNSPEWARDVLAGHFGTREEPHFAETIAAARRGLPKAAGALAALAGDPDQATIVRATALSLMESYDDAGTALALEKGLRDADGMVRIGALRGAARFAPDSLRRRAGHLLDDDYLAVRTEAARLVAGAYVGMPEEHPEKLRMLEVLEEYLDTQRFNADRPEAHTNVAGVSLALGDFAGAEAALDTALGLDADWVPALVNLADLYRATNRDRAAGELLERASALAPESAEVKLARALWLVRQGRHREALPLIAGAVELAPDNSHYAYVLRGGAALGRRVDAGARFAGRDAGTPSRRPDAAPCCRRYRAGCRR